MTPDGPKILTLDIETSPNLAHVWSLWNTNVGLNQLLESGEVMCFAAKWHGKGKIHFFSSYHHGKAAMVQAAHDLLTEADIAVHYNGRKFDIPHLNREFVVAGMPPPAPYQQVDLLAVARKAFRFPSNKLDHVVGALDLGKKVQHAGHSLWVDCLAGRESAWRDMRKYNRHDVLITERLYDRLLPWIPSHPHHGLYRAEVEDCCPNCGSDQLIRQGTAKTSVGLFQRLQCKRCGTWTRASRRLAGVSTTQVR